jgi:hypothetical protein
MAIFFGPYSLSMAQASIRGACGFVLVANSEVIRKLTNAGGAARHQHTDAPIP